MTVRRVLSGALAGAVLAGGLCAEARGACLTAARDDQTAEGRLAYIRFIEHADFKEHAYILALTSPACLEGKDDTDKVESSKRVHVYATDAKLRAKMRALVGRRVRVKGSPFGELTRHHRASIVMHVVAIERR